MPNPTDPQYPISDGVQLVKIADQSCSGSLTRPTSTATYDGVLCGMCAVCRKPFALTDADEPTLIEHVRPDATAPPGTNQAGPTDWERLHAAIEPHLAKTSIIRHGEIEAVLSVLPPRLLMRSSEDPGVRYEIEWDSTGEPVEYHCDGEGGVDGVLDTTAGWLVSHLMQLVQTRQRADEQRALDEYRAAQPIPWAGASVGHLTHTTLPDPTTVTTAFGRINVSNFTTVTLSRVSAPADVPNADSGRFIVIAHGLDYENNQPKALWVQLRPLVNPDDPNHWIDPAGPMHAAALHRGFLADPPPGDDAKERAEARAAISLVRGLVADEVLTRTQSGEWQVAGEKALDPESLALDEDECALLDGFDSARWDSLDRRDRT